MELIGTEVEPDWHMHADSYQEGVTAASRAANDHSKALIASEDELQRAAQHTADPEERFHYRYQAASLAWDSGTAIIPTCAPSVCTRSGSDCMS